MSNLRPFQIIMLGLFGFLGVLAIILLSGFSPEGKEQEQRFGNRVIIWGTLPEAPIRSVLQQLEKGDKAFSVVDYVAVDERQFNTTLVNAIAEGRSPDLILIPNTELVRQRNKLLAIPYSDFPLQEYRDTYSDGAEVFALVDGVYGLPLAVDPLMMYWNRDLFSSNGLATPPATWEALVGSTAVNLIRRDDRRNITQAAVAFGETNNVQNAKEVLLLLAIQSGSRLVYEESGQYKVGINQTASNGLQPLVSATQFFINFSNPNSTLYSWNRALPLDRNAFIAGDLAMYFGFASELSVIQAQNPNLNFDVAKVPQGAASTVKRDYGVFYAFAIPKASPNISGAYGAASALVSPSVANELTAALELAPVSRSLLASGNPNLYWQNIFSAALTARGWLDPNPGTTDSVFSELVEDVTSGRSTVSASTKDAEQRIRLTF